MLSYERYRKQTFWVISSCCGSKEPVVIATLLEPIMYVVGDSPRINRGNYTSSSTPLLLVPPCSKYRHGPSISYVILALAALACSLRLRRRITCILLFLRPFNYRSLQHSHFPWGLDDNFRHKQQRRFSIFFIEFAYCTSYSGVDARSIVRKSIS
jgi:hypothetical protein